MSATVASAGLSVSMQQKAYTEAIQFALEFGSNEDNPSLDAINILVAAAVSAKQAATLPVSFAQVSSFVLLDVQ